MRSPLLEAYQFLGITRRVLLCCCSPWVLLVFITGIQLPIVTTGWGTRWASGLIFRGSLYDLVSWTCVFLILMEKNPSIPESSAMAVASRCNQVDSFLAWHLQLQDDDKELTSFVLPAHSAASWQYVLSQQCAICPGCFCAVIKHQLHLIWNTLKVHDAAL